MARRNVAGSGVGVGLATGINQFVQNFSTVQNQRSRLRLDQQRLNAARELNQLKAEALRRKIQPTKINLDVVQSLVEAQRNKIPGVTDAMIGKNIQKTFDEAQTPEEKAFIKQSIRNVGQPPRRPVSRGIVTANQAELALAKRKITATAQAELLGARLGSKQTLAQRKTENAAEAARIKAEEVAEQNRLNRLSRERTKRIGTRGSETPVQKNIRSRISGISNIIRDQQKEREKSGGILGLSKKKKAEKNARIDKRIAVLKKDRSKLEDQLAGKKPSKQAAPKPVNQIFNATQEDAKNAPIGTILTLKDGRKFEKTKDGLKVIE